MGTQWLIHDVGGFTRLGFWRASISVSLSLSTNQRPVRWFRSFSRALCVCVSSRAQVTDASQPPHPHGRTDKIKCTSCFLSSHSPPLNVPTRVKKPRCAPAGRSERWRTAGRWMLKEAAWCTGRDARGSWRWSSLCRTCWWPRACWSRSTSSGAFRWVGLRRRREDCSLLAAGSQGFKAGNWI